MTTTPTPACDALRFLASSGPALVPSRICCVAVVLRAAAAHEPGSPLAAPAPDLGSPLAAPAPDLGPPLAAPAPDLGHATEAAFPCLAAEMAAAVSHPLLAAGTSR